MLDSKLRLICLAPLGMMGLEVDVGGRGGSGTEGCA